MLHALSDAHGTKKIFLVAAKSSELHVCVKLASNGEERGIFEITK